MPKALWRQMLEASRAEALLAVDLYNQPAQARRLEGFYVHAHLAWLYLLHARFRREGTDFRYRLANGRFERVDGEPKTWDLARCVKERWPDERDPVRSNLHFTILLRNKIEHRYQEAIAVATSGHAQACILNYEEELTDTFESQWSLADSLRFPIFIGTFTQQGVSTLTQLQRRVPKRVQTFIAKFTVGLAPGVAEDQRFEFRLNLIPKRAPKTDADLAFSFVRLDDLTDEERDTVEQLGKSGKAVVIEKERPVHNLGRLRPAGVVEKVNAQIPFTFHMTHFVRAWKKLRVRPDGKVEDPSRTDARYCIYDSAHRDYVYTDAFIQKLVRECGTATGFEQLIGLPAIAKATNVKTA